MIEFEDAIVTKLKELSGVQVIPMPENGAFPGVVSSAQIFVQYIGLSPIGEIDFQGHQDFLGEFAIALRVLGLRTHQGAYPLLAQIKSKLRNFRLPNGEPLRFREERYTDVDRGIWTYLQVYQFRFQEI
jgi:hypothetical protein